MCVFFLLSSSAALVSCVNPGMLIFPGGRFLAYSWTRSVGKKDEAMNILKNGREANPLR